jgi:ureidoglycolate lyase
MVDVSRLDIQVVASPLCLSAFARFGAVIENPKPDLHPGSFTTSRDLPFHPISANQGSAIKYQHVSRMVNLYEHGTARGQAVINMFVCAARQLDPPDVFPVTILERHPFTTQTFIPLSSDPDKTYLVVVAPSLAPTPADEGLPVPDPKAAAAAEAQVSLPGRGLPDLRKLEAFIATGGQAVTYGPGTWHAPMVALGPQGSTVDFVVVQFANGVPIEDCQEVVLSSARCDAKNGEMAAVGTPSGGVLVRIPRTPRIAKL